LYGIKINNRKNKKMETKSLKVSKCIIVRTKDVMNLMDCSEDHARKILQKVRKSFNKPVRQHVTMQEYSAISGFSIEEIQEALSV
jgi:hypothetical protein